MYVLYPKNIAHPGNSRMRNAACGTENDTALNMRRPASARYMEDEEWERLLALIGKNLAPRALRPALPRA